MRASEAIGAEGPAGDAAAVPLVLLPGTLCDARLFAPLLERLAPRRFLSLPLAGGDTVAAVAAAVLAAAPPRFALLGFSLGRIVALDVARQAPDRLAGLALVDSNARAVPADQIAARRAAGRLADDEPAEALVERLWPRYVAAAARDDAGLRRLIADMARGHGKAVLARQTEVMLSRPDSLALLATLALPGLVLAGADDALCPPAMQREMAAALPGARLALIAGAGHFAPLEAPAAVAAEVGRWLAAVDRGARPAKMLFDAQQQETS